MNSPQPNSLRGNSETGFMPFSPSRALNTRKGSGESRRHRGKRHSGNGSVRARSSLPVNHASYVSPIHHLTGITPCQHR